VSQRKLILALAALVLAACGKEKPSTSMAQDGATPPDSLVPIADVQPTPDAPPPVPLPPPAAPASNPTKPAAPPPKTVATKPAPSQQLRDSAVQPPNLPPAPPARTEVTAPSGTTVAGTALDSIHSHVTKVGDAIRLRVGSDVMGADGAVAIPAGSIVTLTVVEIAAAPNRDAKGTLVLSARSVEINGVSYPITARATAMATELKSRGVGASEVAKTGAGAVAGGIIGRVIGGKTGTVVGAVGGAAAGAAVAAKDVDRDIILHSGGAVTLTLRDDFSRPKQ